ncbi:hypothetical protein EV715DRAFT_189537 [Schizophyllum commune]
MASSPREQSQEKLYTCYHCERSLLLDLNPPPPPAQNEFLRSGRLLSAADSELMKQEAAKTDALLNNVLREIGDMWEMLASLENAERVLQDLRATQRAYLAPIRRLPPEVLSDIFKLYCGDPCTDITLKHCPPLVLGSVYTILDMHHIWANFRTSDVSRLTLESLLGRLRTFLVNSGNVPLRYPVRYGTGIGIPHGQQEILSELLPYSHRWTHLIIALRPRSWADKRLNTRDFFDSVMGLSLSCLTTLKVKRSDFTRGDMSFFNRVRTLRRLVILEDSNVGAKDDGRESMIPWHQLEELSTNASAAYALTLLRRCPQLRSWKHKGAVSSTPLPAPSLPTPLSRLQKIDMRIYSLSDVKILEGIETTELRHLSLAWMSNSGTEATGTGNIARWAHDLHQLHLSDPPRALITEDFIGKLRSATSLKLRASRDAPLTQSFLDALSASGQAATGRMLPRLEVLDLSGHSTFNASALARMVELRKVANNPPLEVFCSLSPC